MQKCMICLFVLVLAATAPAQNAAAPDDLGDFASALRASAVVSHTAAAPGRTFHLAVEILIDEDWVYYSPAPGEIAMPARVTVDAGDLVAGDVLWPADQPYKTRVDETAFVVNHVYKRRAIVFVPLTVPQDAQPGARTISLKVAGQICGNENVNNVCVNVEANASAVVRVAPASVASPAWTQPLADALILAVTGEKLPALRYSDGALTLWAGLGLAFLAGLILNVMPCVLPVIPLRVMSLVQMAGERRGRFITLGLAFAAGIVLFFVAIAAANTVFALTAKHTLNLNVHFQYRSVRIAMALVLVALAGNLFGLFSVSVPTRLAEMDEGRRRHGHVTALAMGVMMAILATPCSFAVLAAALAWAQIQPPLVAAMGIITIGVGMAAPHAAIVAFPKLVNKLPRPGRWMELLRQGMGFMLLPVAVWLIFAGSQDTYAGWVVCYAVVLSACLWVWGAWVRYDASIARKLLVRGLAAVLAVVAGLWMLTPASEGVITFEPFSLQRIDDAHRDGRTVLVKFTSATCLSCIWLDRTLYSDPEVAAELIGRNIAVIKADTTDAAAPASKMLRDRFSGAPPLTVLLPPGGKPIMLYGKFTKADLFEKLKTVTVAAPAPLPEPERPDK